MPVVAVVLFITAAQPVLAAQAAVEMAAHLHQIMEVTAQPIPVEAAVERQLRLRHLLVKQAAMAAPAS